MSFAVEFQLDHINLDEFLLMIGRVSKLGIKGHIVDKKF